MKTVAIIQARMGSSRFPGKVLQPLPPDNRTVLARVIGEVKKISGLDEIVVAIPEGPLDDVLVPHVRAAGVQIFRGPEDDVLTRYYRAAVIAKADVIMRITADCPLIDPGLCAAILDMFKTHRSQFDFVSNTAPRTFPKGLDCEVFSFELLRRAHMEALDAKFREHVTLWMLESWYRPKVRVGRYRSEEDLSHVSVTLDTLADYKNICDVLSRISIGKEKSK